MRYGCLEDKYSSVTMPSMRLFKLTTNQWLGLFLMLSSYYFLKEVWGEGSYFSIGIAFGTGMIGAYFAYDADKK